MLAHICQMKPLLGQDIFSYSKFLQDLYHEGILDFAKVFFRAYQNDHVLSALKSIYIIST